MKNVLGMLKGNDRIETLEKYSILFITIGALILSVGIGLTAINTKGISSILAMFGSLVVFLSTVLLIVSWLLREFFGEKSSENLQSQESQ